MNIVTWLQPLLLRERLNRPTDLESWRNWLVSAAAIFALFALPLSMVTTFPIFIMGKRYGLMGLDLGILLVAIVRLFIKRGSYKYRGYFWLAVLYIMTITFFVALGPYHARPAWLVMCAIMAALFFGARAAVLSTGINAAILMVLYWSIGPENQAWTSEYAAPFSKWVMFVVNVSLITLASSGAAGLLLDRLDWSLKKERDAHNKLLAESEKLHAAHSALKAQVEERKQVEEALRESEEKYRSFVANAMDAIFIVQEGLIKFPNPITLALTGYSQEELTTLPILTFIHPDDRDMVLDNYRRRLEGEEVPSTYSFRIINKKGEELWGQINAALITWDGKPAVLCFIRDITERKQIEREKANVEEQLRQSQKIEAIGRLAGGIAHDFNNLLTVISGNCQLSLLELKERDPLKGNIEEIKRASEKAADLTRQLLAFSRRQILEMRVLNLNSLLMNLDKMLHRLIGEDIELITLLADDLGRVKTDSGWVEQIIMNLAVNARDAMPNGGKLTIETANVDLDEGYARGHIAVKPGRYVMLSVSDTGVGMTPEVRQQVFEPFFTTKEKGKGTGLGLSTVYGIVKQSGGNIWVYSEPGLGTTFKIYLPSVDEPFEEMREKVTREEFPRGNETILVVEDEEDVRRLAVRALERQGYRVLEASCGDDALVLSKEPIHMILTDVVMPGMSGRQLADRLIPLHPKMKVLYMSGYTDNAIVHHGVLEEGVNYIQKPFTIDKLMRKVREILDKDLKHVV